MTNPSKTKILNAFHSVAKQLQLEFESLTSEINHSPSKGRCREEAVVKTFLRPHITRNVDLTQGGEVISTSGDVSGECDILIHEPMVPGLVKRDGYIILPVESLYGAIEVKSYLNSPEMEKTQKNFCRLKQLKKTAYYPQSRTIIHTTNLYGVDWKYFPTLGFVFAYDSIGLIHLCDKLNELQENIELHHRVDSVCVLNKGMLVNWSDEEQKIYSCPTQKTRLRPFLSENPLLLLVIHLQQLLQHAWMPRFRLLDYLPDTEFGRFAD